MERHNFGLKVKSVDDAGSFTGLGAVYNNVDLGGDQILPGAFSRTITATKIFPLLWQHDAAQPIGSVKVSDSAQGLQVAGQLLLSDPTAQKAYQFLKAGIIRGLSIGYDTLQESFENGVRQLRELKLWEFSIVTFPMNELAGVTAVKAMSDSERARHLKNIAMHVKAMQMSLKALGVDCDDDFSDVDPADDPAFFEGDDDDEEMSKAFLVELRKLAAQAGQLAQA